MVFLVLPSLRKSLWWIFGIAASIVVLASPLPAGAASTVPRVAPGLRPAPFAPRVPSTSSAASNARTPSSAQLGLTPLAQASWAGISDASPPDPNGAIGPHSYIEIINEQIAIYDRTGVLIQTQNLQTLTGHPQGDAVDPIVIWDPDTQRFYYNAVDYKQGKMTWGFSKTDNPTTVPDSFCNYTSDFGYAAGEVPDYPKLGQSKNFLLIGVNHYPTLTTPHADRSDLLWIGKPQGTGKVTTCPSPGTFKSGRFADLRDQGGKQTYTPVSAVQTDPSNDGLIVSESDIECPDICGTGTQITVHTVTPTVGDPTTPVLSPPHSLTVPVFGPPDPVPQKGTNKTLDASDGKLERAVVAFDPVIGQPAIWTGHNVKGAGNRAEFRWYEIVPAPAATPTLVSSGAVNDPSLHVFNAAIGSDRTVNPTGAAHGDAIVIGFSTSSSATFPAVQMVSKIGNGPQSAFVMVHQSNVADTANPPCTAPPPPCRWGDYGGAASDPASSLTSTHGEVWLTNESVSTLPPPSTDGVSSTWNWEATLPADPQAPTPPTIVSPADGSYNSSGTVVLSGSAEANSTVEVFDGRASKGTVAADGSGGWSKTLNAVADGSHSYSATATAAGNTSAASAITHVTVDEPPTVDFSGPSSVVAGQAASFASSAADSDGSISSYSWSFGDGKSSTVANPSHSYAAAGGYSVTLTVTDSDGRTATATHPVTVKPAPPTIVSPADGSYNSSGTVVLSGSAEANSTVEVFDGGASKGTVPADGSGGWSKTLNAVADGSHSYSATATAAGNTSAASAITHVTVDELPTVDFSGPSSVVVGQAASFASSAADSDGSISSYSWSFGDGKSSTVANPSHSYAAAGGYSVTLTVTDSDGRTATATHSVTVKPAPPTIAGGAATAPVGTPAAPALAPAPTLSLSPGVARSGGRVANKSSCAGLRGKKRKKCLAVVRRRRSSAVRKCRKLPKSRRKACRRRAARIH